MLFDQEVSYLVGDERICPIAANGCLCVKNKTIREVFCNRDYTFCPGYDVFAAGDVE